MSTTVLPPAAINPNDHGPRVVLVGAIMLTATILMVVIAAYNRFYARTLQRVDSPLLLLGGALDVVFFALCVVMTNHGLGRHVDDLTSAQITWLKRMLLGSLFVYFLSNCAVKVSYNILARQTARSKTYHRVMDAFSLFIILWTLANIIVIAIYMKDLSPPSRIFMYISGVISILIVAAQLFAFLWIIWRTSAPMAVKVRWTISIGAFVPFCIASIIARLVYTPKDIFGGDWTFTGVTLVMLFLIDLHLVVITILAPNLPVFFAKASTGGIHFVPGESLTTRNSRATGQGASYAMKSGTNRSTYSDKANAEKPYSGKGDAVISTTIQHAGEMGQKKTSFDSDVIMLRRSVEMRDSDGTTPEPFQMRSEHPLHISSARSETSRSQNS